MITPDQFKAHELLVCNTIEAHDGWHVERFDTKFFDDTTKRNLHNRKIESPLRHLPDLIATHNSGRHVLIECKSADERNLDSPNYSIEVASLDACIGWAQLSTPVLIVWHDLSATRPSAVLTLRSTRLGPPSTFGSGDPYYLVNRKDLRQVSNRLAYYLHRLVAGRFNDLDQPSLFEVKP